MFKTIEEAIAEYRKMLKEYILNMDKMKATYRNNDVLGWGRQDYEYVMGWSATFKALEKALGFTEKETKDIEDEVSEEIKKEGK